MRILPPLAVRRRWIGQIKGGKIIRYLGRFVMLLWLVASCPLQLLGSSGDTPLDEAKQEFPDLADPNSIFSKAYAAEEAALRKTQPDFFSNGNWQLMLAYRVAMKLGLGGASAKDSTSKSQASPPPTPSQASATEDEATAARKISPYVLTLKGNKGSGSGFVLKRGEKTYLVTNVHVIDGDENVKVASIDKDFPFPDSIMVSRTRDIVMAEVDFSEGLQAEDDFSQVAINDATLSLGNSSGAGVSRLIKGKLLGLGNDLIETDAAYVHGNSGSPIVHLKTGKVLGVVTYVEQSPSNRLVAESDLKDLRHFAHRIDNLPANDLVPMSTSSFFAESQIPEAINERNEKILNAISVAERGSEVRGTSANLPFETRVRDELASEFPEIRWNGYRLGDYIGTGDAVAPVGVLNPYLALFVAFQDIPSLEQIKKLHPYHVRKLHFALKERLALVDRIYREDGARSIYVTIKVDKNGRPMAGSWLDGEVYLRENIKAAITASDAKRP